MFRNTMEREGEGRGGGGGGEQGEGLIELYRTKFKGHDLTYFRIICLPPPTP